MHAQVPVLEERCAQRSCSGSHILWKTRVPAFKLTEDLWFLAVMVMMCFIFKACLLTDYSTFQVPNFLSLHNHTLHLGQSNTESKIPQECWDATPLSPLPSAGCENILDPGPIKSLTCHTWAHEKLAQPLIPGKNSVCVNDMPIEYNHIWCKLNHIPSPLGSSIHVF